MFAAADTGRVAAPMTSEHAEQAALIIWADHLAKSGQLPQLSMLMAIPNGGYRPPAVAARMKAEGVRAGVPDLFLAYPNAAGYHGLWIEMKVGKNRPTPAQWEWIEALEGYGYAVAVCWGMEEAQEVVLDYLDNNRLFSNRQKEK